jgi:hypothetical protein
VRTNFYIDGFNLYYGCLKGTKYRWLNVRTFCESLLASTPQHTVGRIRYFTARVRTQGTYSSGTEQRQDTYLRAIATLGIDVQFGHYQYKPTFATSYPLSNPPKKVQILKAEEKGSDVNLAAWLLLDGFKQDYEQAIVISNDSDLATPIRMVRDDLKLPVGVAFPCTNPKRTKSALLQQVGTFYKNVRPSMIQGSQFPTNMTDAQGAFSCPPRWL